MLYSHTLCLYCVFLFGADLGFLVFVFVCHRRGVCVRSASEVAFGAWRARGDQAAARRAVVHHQTVRKHMELPLMQLYHVECLLQLGPIKMEPAEKEGEFLIFDKVENGCVAWNEGYWMLQMKQFECD